jgi:hypothetical protein
MKIKKFIEFISETALVGPIGPNFGYQSLYVPLKKDQTEIVFSNIKSRFYTYNDYQDLYNEYLSAGNKQLEGGFSRNNLETVLLALDDQEQETN